MRTVFHAAQLVERWHGNRPASLQHLVAERAQNIRVKCKEVRNVRERARGLGRSRTMVSLEAERRCIEKIGTVSRAASSMLSSWSRINIGSALQRRRSISRAPQMGGK